MLGSLNNNSQNNIVEDTPVGNVNRIQRFPAPILSNDTVPTRQVTVQHNRRQPGLFTHQNPSTRKRLSLTGASLLETGVASRLSQVAEIPGSSQEDALKMEEPTKKIKSTTP